MCLPHALVLAIHSLFQSKMHPVTSQTFVSCPWSDILIDKWGLYKLARPFMHFLISDTICIIRSYQQGYALASEVFTYHKPNED